MAGIFHCQLHSSNGEKKPINPSGFIFICRDEGLVLGLPDREAKTYVMNSKGCNQNLQIWALIVDKLKQTDAKAFPHCSFLHCLCTNMAGVKRVRLQSVRAAPPRSSQRKPLEDQKALFKSTGWDKFSIKNKKNNFRSEVTVQGFHWKDMTE